MVGADVTIKKLQSVVHNFFAVITYLFLLFNLLKIYELRCCA